MDEVVFEEPRGRIQGVTFRAYDAKTGQWTILWVSDTAGIAWPPVVGEFKGGRGAFYSSEPYQGRQIFCRFLWFSDDLDHCHWEQAFSPDYGHTWETNWMNWLTRVPSSAAATQ